MNNFLVSQMKFQLPWALILAFYSWVSLAKLIPYVRKAPLKPVLRFKDQASYLRPSPNGRYLAYLAGSLQSPVIQRKLRVADLDRGEIIEIHKGFVGEGFGWAPYGFRLAYRQLSRKPHSKVNHANIWIYDVALKQSKRMAELPEGASWPVTDPISHALRYLTSTGIKVLKFHYPDHHIPDWRQRLSKFQPGFWIVTKKAVFWQIKGSGAVRQVSPKNSHITAYSVSADGEQIAWSTHKVEVMISRNGSRAKLIGRGRHPSWHPTKRQLIFSGARTTGNQISGYDLRLMDNQQNLHWLTNTAHSQEIWPFWDPRSQQIYTTVAQSDRLYTLQRANHHGRHKNITISTRE